MSHDSLEPDGPQVVDFWSSLWSQEQSHNQSAKWLESLKDKFQTSISSQSGISISISAISQASKNMKNWKAPGPDQVHGFWIKHFKSLYRRLASQLQLVYENGPPRLDDYW